MKFVTAGSERMRIDSSGRMIIGHTASISGVQNMKLQVYSDTYDGSVTLGRWTANNLGQYVNFIKSRHSTVGSNAIVQDDDVLGSIANYLRMNGYKKNSKNYDKSGDIYKSIFAYNHADNYVMAVLELSDNIKKRVLSGK